MAVNINFYDNRYFKTWNYKYLKVNPEKIIIECVALLLGDYAIYRKQAAILLLKALVRDAFRKEIFEDKKLYPISRNDPRVLKWVKEVTKIGRCEMCGSTENIEAHHILYWSEYPIGRIDLKNGRCLCHKCHTKEHEGEQVYNLMLAK